MWEIFLKTSTIQIRTTPLLPVGLYSIIAHPNESSFVKLCVGIPAITKYAIKGIIFVANKDQVPSKYRYLVSK